MDPLEIKDGDYQMDPIEIKDDEEHPTDMLVDQPRFLEPLCPEEVNEDTRVYPRVGDEYQVEVPDLLTEEEQAHLRYSWSDEEAQTFLLGLYIFGKNLVQVFKIFNEGTFTFEQFILTLRSTVGAQVLVDAVGIGKGKYDLTGFALDPSRNHGISTRPEIPVGKACSALSSGDIIKFLTGDFRLSKARSNDLFWEAVWPRLLSRGWHSEQPKDSSQVGKHALVFLIPGVKKFSRKKLVKGNHYFDSVSDVLSKVASEPRLLEFGAVGGNDDSGIKNENGWIHDSEHDRNTLPNKKPSYSRPTEAGCSPELMKFTVVDTSLVQGEEPSKVRSLRNLPTDSSHGYMSSPRSEDSGSDSSEDPSDSEDSSQSYEHISTDRSTTSVKYASEERKSKPPTIDKMDSNVIRKAVSSGTLTSINGHISTDQGFSTMNNVCSSTTTILPVEIQKVHATTTSTEISFQFDQRVTAESQVFLAPFSKRRRLVSSKTERAGRRNTTTNENYYWKQVDEPLQQDAPGANEAPSSFVWGALPNSSTADAPGPNEAPSSFVWGAMPNSSTNISFDMNNKKPYCRQLDNVPPNAETMVYKETCQNRQAIDLNIPQMPSDYESNVSLVRPPCSSGTEAATDPLPDMDASSDVLYEEFSFNSRRHSSRSRPPTARALEALACGFLGTKQKGRETNFPSSSRSSRSVRRPRRSPDTALPFPSDNRGCTSHFPDPPMGVNGWSMSNPQYQMIHSSPSDKSTDKATPDLFVADKSTDKGVNELFGIP
nr:unnamed protein product [Digitaria exilis]